MRILICILIIGFTSCVGGKKEVPDVQVFYEAKKANLRLQRLEECKEEATVEAEKFVDKLMVKWASSIEDDSIKFPRKPRKPNTPAHIIDKQ